MCLLHWKKYPWAAYHGDMATSSYLRSIGVLGGMGPLATLDFMHKVLDATPAATDQQHVPLIVHSVPQIPDRSTAIQQQTDTPFLPMLAGIRQLERCGVDAIVIPCNTAHFWYDRLARATQTPILHIVDAVADELARQDSTGGRYALMATRGTLTTGVYDRMPAGFSGHFEAPDESVQSQVDDTIRLVKAGQEAEARRIGSQALQQLIDEQGYNGVVLACTELPVALRQTAHDAYCLDATQALARQAVRFSLHGGTQPQPSIIRQAA